MAYSIRTHRFPSRPRVPLEVRAYFTRESLAMQARRARSHAAADPLLFAWQAVTLPLWLGSGIPAPDRPALREPAPDRPALREPALAIEQDLPSAVWLTHELKTVQRRFWLASIASATLRGASIGLIITTLWALMALANLVDLPTATWIFTIAAVGAIAGLGFGLLSKPATLRVAAMLDRTLHLDQRLVTAFDRTTTGERDNPLRQLQLADAANVYAEVKPDIKGTATLSVREGVVFTLAIIALVTVLLLSISSNGMPATAKSVVPQFVPSSQRFAQEQQQAEAQKQAELSRVAPSTTANSGSDQAATAVQDLNQLANALASNSTTKDAADQIAQGNY
ncbi:MAG TPA: hypothetical protein VFQ54_08195, partial [Thermomicrobiales bacterium]|nr:hypothetical protein [Thermomicrobiales bacterium]